MRKHANLAELARIWPDLREICAKLARICANLRKFAKLFLQKMRKFARNLRPRLLRYRLFRSKCCGRGEVLAALVQGFPLRRGLPQDLEADDLAALDRQTGVGNDGSTT